MSTITGQLPILNGKRLILRPFDLSDAGEVQRLAGHRAIADTTTDIPHPYEDGMAEQWISTHRDQFEQGTAVKWGKFEDVVMYGILESEWRKRSKK